MQRYLHTNIRTLGMSALAAVVCLTLAFPVTPTQASTVMPDGVTPDGNAAPASETFFFWPDLVCGCCRPGELWLAAPKLGQQLAEATGEPVCVQPVAAWLDALPEAPPPGTSVRIDGGMFAPEVREVLASKGYVQAEPVEPLPGASVGIRHSAP